MTTVFPRLAIRFTNTSSCKDQGPKRVRNGVTYHTREQHATYIREELTLIDADNPVLANEVRHLFKSVA